jgi:hypothetical protein
MKLFLISRLSTYLLLEAEADTAVVAAAVAPEVT